MPEAKTSPGGVPTEDEKGRAYGSDVERVARGYAPLMDPSNPDTREAREAAALEKLGGSPDTVNVAESDEDAAKRIMRERALPTAPDEPMTSVTVNGRQTIFPTSGDPPAAAKEVIENISAALRTGQMKGLAVGRTEPAAPAPAATPPSRQRAEGSRQ
jgi:hypothetical protein